MELSDQEKPSSSAFLSEAERQRFDRQLRLPQCGEEGQLRIKQSSIAVIGAGGLGCAALSSLALTGVGRLLIFDFDRVSMSNLHRQILYRQEDIGMTKVMVAKQRLLNINPALNIEVYDRPLRRYSDQELLMSVDLILDCTDRFSARANIAALCKALNKPHVYASVSGSDGQVALFYPNGSCFRCLFPHLPTGGVIQSCDQGGVLGVTPQILGSLQAQKAIDFILADRSQISKKNYLQIISTLPLNTYQLTLSSKSDCPLCALNEGSHRLEPYPIPVSTFEAHHKLNKGWHPVIVDVRSQVEYQSGHISGALNIDHHQLLAWLDNNTLPLEYLESFLQSEVLIYCQKGPRAEQTARALHQYLIKHSDYKDVYELIGGYSVWRDDLK